MLFFLLQIKTNVFSITTIVSGKISDHKYLLALTACVRTQHNTSSVFLQGQQELKETVNIWKQKHHLMSHFFKETQEPKPKDFLSKFLAGQ